MTATVPVAQYANLQPGVEFDVPEGQTLQEAMDFALGEIRRIWNMVSDKPLRTREDESALAQAVSTAVELVCWASGTRVMFEPVSHTYGDGSWLSGSTFAHKFTSEFAAKVVAGKVAAKVEPRHDGSAAVEAGEIVEMWDKNAEASSLFGSAVHAALELRGKYGWVSRLTKGSDEGATPKHPTLKAAVESFFAGRENERAIYEAFVADPTLKHCGQIDRLRIMDERNHVQIEDFKTNGDLHKKVTVRAPFKGVVEATQLGLYWLQLSFYARILAVHGLIVDGLVVHHWDGSEWHEYRHDVIDVSEGIKG